MAGNTVGSSAGEGVAGLVQALKREKIKVRVDMKTLIKVCLFFSCVHGVFCLCVQDERLLCLRGTPPSHLPHQAATDKLAGAVAAAKERGVERPFPVADMGDFVPQWAQTVCFQHMCLTLPFHVRWGAAQGKKRALEEQDISREQEGLRQVAEAIAGNFHAKAAGEPRRLDQTRWIAASENLSIAYAMCGAWQYFASRVHFRNCMRIAGWLLLVAAGFLVHSSFVQPKRQVRRPAAVLCLHSTITR